MLRSWRGDGRARPSRRSRPRPAARPGPARRSPEDESERRQQSEGLRLALADATAQLQAACRPVHRDMLRQRIAAIEASLASLSGAARGDRG